MDDNNIPFMQELIEEFKVFVREEMKANLHLDYDDHFNFLKESLRAFIEFKEAHGIPCSCAGCAAKGSIKEDPMGPVDEDGVPSRWP